jgi:hypothetical protein
MLQKRATVHGNVVLLISGSGGNLYRQSLHGLYHVSGLQRQRPGHLGKTQAKYRHHRGPLHHHRTCKTDGARSCSNTAAGATPRSAPASGYGRCGPGPARDHGPAAAKTDDHARFPPGLRPRGGPGPGAL